MDLEKKIGDLSLDELELSVRAKKILASVGIENLRQLAQVDREQLKKMPGMSRKPLNEILEVLTHYGVEEGGNKTTS